MKKLILAALFISTAAHAYDFGDFGNNASRALEGARQDQCRRSCGPDYKCVQDYCDSMREPQYQPRPKPVQYDYTCISQCSKAGYVYQLCQKNCSY